MFSDFKAPVIEVYIFNVFVVSGGDEPPEDDPLNLQLLSASRSFRETLSPLFICSGSLSWSLPVSAGLSEAQPVLLLSAGGADAGPHELHRQPGASRRHVHLVFDIRRAHRTR